MSKFGLQWNVFSLVRNWPALIKASLNERRRRRPRDSIHCQPTARFSKLASSLGRFSRERESFYFTVPLSGLRQHEPVVGNLLFAVAVPFFCAVFDPRPFSGEYLVFFSALASHLILPPLTLISSHLISLAFIRSRLSIAC